MKQGGNTPTPLGAYAELTPAQKRAREKAKKKGMKVRETNLRLDKPNSKMNRARVGD